MFSIHTEALCPSQRMPVSVTLPQKQGRWAEADLSLNEDQGSLEEAGMSQPGFTQASFAWRTSSLQQNDLKPELLSIKRSILK